MEEENYHNFKQNCNEILTKERLICLGRVLQHGVVVIGYSPPFMNKALLFQLLIAKEESTGKMVESSINSLSKPKFLRKEHAAS